MANGRFISKSVAEDKRLNELSVEAQLVYMMAIPHLDRDGLIAGDVPVLFGKVCPRRMEFAGLMPDIVRQWVESELVVSYETDNGDVLWFVGFSKNQQGLRYERETPSQYPPPPGYDRDDKAGLFPVVPDKCRTNAGDMPENRPQVQGQEQDQVEVEDQHQGQGQEPPDAPDESLDDVMARLQPQDDNHDDLPPRYSKSVAETMYSESMGRTLRPGDRGKLEDMSARASPEQIARAMARTADAASNGTHIRDGVAYASAILESILTEGSDRQKTSQRRMSKIDANMLAVDEAFALVAKHGVHPV